ncbi:MAG: glycosyltransferase family 9 protein [Pseudorhodoplanes sp.]|nr:glycosyltransferase family 9 protein [Pseudorhodoplanes sp.]
MKVDTMRRIDRLAGVPLCAVATVVVWVASRFRRAPGRVKRVLMIELSEMGTTILAAPAMKKAREELHAELYFAIFRKNVGSLELLGTFPPANVFTIRDTSIATLLVDTMKFLLWTRENAIDTVIDLELFSRFTALLTGFSGAARRVGYYRFHNEGLYRGEMLTHRVSYNPHIHIAQNLIALVNALIVPSPQVPYSKTPVNDADLKVSLPAPGAAARETMIARIRAAARLDPEAHRVVLINPNASELLPHRRWTPVRYAELIKRILKQHKDALVLITGAPNERAEAEALARECGPRCVSLAGHTALAELPALYSLAKVMVTNDSGPSHFAAASGLKTIVLFGPETPKLYQPLGPSRAIYAGIACSPCVSASNHRKTACTDNVCMQAISVDQVFAAVTEELSH